jgi:enoyl-CoA hydratase
VSETANAEFVLVDKPAPNVTVVTLNRPERMNAMAFDVMIPLREALEAVSHDNETRAVIITGAGHGFCSGADLVSPGRMPHIEGLTRTTIAQRAGELLHDVILEIVEMPQPVIAAINGPAIGGGLCLAAACDVRLAAPEAYFRAAGINNGLTAAELGLSFVLPRVIGSGRSTELMLTGRDADAEEAERIGLVSRVVPQDELLPACLEVAERIAGLSRIGIELTKKMAWAGLESSSFRGHMSNEMNAQLYVRLTTANFEEAIKARSEDRAPDFQD